MCTQTSINCLLSLQLSASVKKIYDEYLSATSPNTVNIDDRAKKSIESRMATPPAEIFDEACEQVRQYIFFVGVLQYIYFGMYACNFFLKYMEHSVHVVAITKACFCAYYTHYLKQLRELTSTNCTRC